MTAEEFRDMNFPLAGMDLRRAYGDQQPRDIGEGAWARTTRLGRNVRGYEPAEDRKRGGSRGGLVRYIKAPVVLGWVVQELTTLVGVGYTPPGGPVQKSQSGRIVSLVSVSQGKVYVATGNALTWANTINGSSGTPPLNFSGVLYSTQLNQKLWFADGVHWRYYDPVINTVLDWTATAGTLPTDSDGNAPRLICTWRGRIVLSGLLKDGQNWFMSAVDDPTNWNYFPAFITPTQAVAGNNGPQGLIGDLVTCLIPYTDDVLIVGGDHSIYRFQGDPAAGGQIDLVTNSIGMAWGQAWCMDPYGAIYFLSNQMGLYRMTPGQLPERLSQPIEQLAQAYDSGRMILRLAWNDRYQGVHVFATFADQPAKTTHLFWEARANAWWLDQFANNLHNPLCCCTFDGNSPTDRATLIGSWDGYVRSLSSTAPDDDGTPIQSVVVIGPLNTKDLDELLVKDLQAVLSETSGNVGYAVYVGQTAEQALNNPPVDAGVWGPGRNLNSMVRRAGYALYVKITASNPWQMEQIRARVAAEGKVRRRN